jgi:hypothetical protein
MNRGNSESTSPARAARRAAARSQISRSRSGTLLSRTSRRAPQAEASHAAIESEVRRKLFSSFSEHPASRATRRIGSRPARATRRAAPSVVTARADGSRSASASPY